MYKYRNVDLSAAIHDKSLILFVKIHLAYDMDVVILVLGHNNLTIMCEI